MKQLPQFDFFLLEEFIQNATEEITKSRTLNNNSSQVHYKMQILVQ